MFWVEGEQKEMCTTVSTRATFWATISIIHSLPSFLRLHFIFSCPLGDEHTGHLLCSVIIVVVRRLFLYS